MNIFEANFRNQIVWGPKLQISTKLPPPAPAKMERKENLAGQLKTTDDTVHRMHISKILLKKGTIKWMIFDTLRLYLLDRLQKKSNEMFIYTLSKKTVYLKNCIKMCYGESKTCDIIIQIWLI